VVPCPRIVSFFVNWSGEDPRLDLRLSISGIESIQADREILLHENMGLRRAIFLEKRKKKCQGPLKNYLLDPEDVEQRAFIVFSLAKIQRARERKAEIEAQEQAEEARKEREKAERKLRKEWQEVEKRQRAEERKRAQEERQTEKGRKTTKISHPAAQNRYYNTETTREGVGKTDQGRKKD
jgi:hypothetical protein